MTSPLPEMNAVSDSEASVLQPADFLFPETGPEAEGLVFESYHLEEVEKTVVRRALKKHGGNISHAARELGITRTSLYRRMEKYGL
jgi:transcriptional regulator of acetoin/glycerol metabolism